MNNLLPLLFTLFIAFKQNYGDSNTTAPGTTASGSQTTQMYTSSTTMIYDTPPEMTEMDGVEQSECTFYTTISLQESENFEVTLCGYEEEEVPMVRITLEYNWDRWVGVGFINNTNFNEEKKMTNVYAIIAPISSTDIQERYMITNGNVGDELKSTLTIIEDVFDAGIRTLTFTRKLTIGVNALLPDNGDDVDKYFDFGGFKGCDDEIKVLYAFGKKNNQQFSASVGHGTHRGSENAVIESLLAALCDEYDGDDTIQNMPSIIMMFIISIIAILIN